MFRFFWHETDAVGGRAFFESWHAWSIRRRLDPVRKVGRMLKTRLDRILMWFAAPISNEVAEGGNTGLKARRTVGSAARSGVCVFVYFPWSVSFKKCNSPQFSSASTSLRLLPWVSFP